MKSSDLGVDLAVFDLTGTAIEDGGEIEEAFTSALAARGVTLAPERFSAVRGMSKRKALEDLLPPECADLAETYDCFLENLKNRFRSSGARWVEGAPGAVSFFRERGVAVALNTGLDRSIVEVLLELLTPTLDVAAVVCGDEVARGRPAPYLLFRAMERTGVESVHRVLAVGDTTRDLHAGFHAGVKYNVGVLTGAHDRSRLEQAPHSHILTSVTDLPLIF
jgi:phosphoglycolate phosphatase